MPKELTGMMHGIELRLMVTGEDIREARKALKLSQASFARRIGVNQSTVHRWETRGLPMHGVAAKHISDFILKLAILKRSKLSQQKKKKVDRSDGVRLSLR